MQGAKLHKKVGERLDLEQQRLWRVSNWAKGREE